MKTNSMRFFVFLLITLNLCSCVKNQNATNVTYTDDASVSTMDPNVNNSNYQQMMQNQTARAQAARAQAVSSGHSFGGRGR